MTRNTNTSATNASDDIVSVTTFGGATAPPTTIVGGDSTIGGVSASTYGTSSLFVDLPQVEGTGASGTTSTPQNVVVVYDVSGSTSCVFEEFGPPNRSRNRAIYLKEAELTCKLLSEWGVPTLRVVFFSDKVVKDPTPYLVSNPDVLGARAKAVCGGTTYPHKGLDAIPPEWLSKPNTKVLIVTDGQMSERAPYPEFCRSIRKITDGYPDVTFGIIAVEATNRNYERDEGVAAGCDIYRALQSNALTDRVSLFRAYAQNYTEGYELFSNVKVPAGYVAWPIHSPSGTAATGRASAQVPKMFALDREGEFLGYVRQQIATIHDLEIYNLVRDLSRAVSSIIRQRHSTPFMRRSTLEAYARLFNDARIEPAGSVTPEELRQMLVDSVMSDLEGSALLTTNFIADKKARFALANRQLNADVQSALGALGTRALTFPIGGGRGALPQNPLAVGYSTAGSDLARGDGGNAGPPWRMWSLPLDDCRHPLVVSSGMTLPACCYESGNDAGGRTRMPIIPLERRSTPVTDQCLRQYVRAVMHLLTGMETQHDGVKFAALILMTMVVHSPNVDAPTKRAFLDLGRVMLQKTLAGNEMTELEYLRAGNSHPNYGATLWHDVLGRTIGVLFSSNREGVTGDVPPSPEIDPYHMWYTICRTLDGHLGDNTLSRNQLRLLPNVTEENSQSVYDTVIAKLLSVCGPTGLEVVHVESGSEYVYQCPLTMTSTVETGGWVYRPHRDRRGHLYAPKMVLSEIGFREMLADCGVAVPDVLDMTTITTLGGYVQCLYSRLNIPVSTGFCYVGPRPVVDPPVFPSGVYLPRGTQPVPRNPLGESRARGSRGNAGPPPRAVPSRTATTVAHPTPTVRASGSTPSLQVAHVGSMREAKQMKKRLTELGLGVRILIGNAGDFREQLETVASQAVSSGMARVAVVVSVTPGNSGLVSQYPVFLGDKVGLTALAP